MVIHVVLSIVGGVRLLGLPANHRKGLEPFIFLVALKNNVSLIVLHLLRFNAFHFFTSSLLHH